MSETVEQRNPTTGTEVQATSERNSIQIRGFKVELTVVECRQGDNDCLEVGGIVDQRFFAPGSADIRPADTQAIPTQVIPAWVVQEIRDRNLLGGSRYVVRVTLRAVGGRNAEEELESGDFVYYVTLCEGCLTTGLRPQKACPGGERTGYCGLAQDFVLDCCYIGDIPYCPAADAPTTE